MGSSPLFSFCCLLSPYPICRFASISTLLHRSAASARNPNRQISPDLAEVTFFRDWPCCLTRDFRFFCSRRLGFYSFNLRFPSKELPFSSILFFYRFDPPILRNYKILFFFLDGLWLETRTFPTFGLLNDAICMIFILSNRSYSASRSSFSRM